MKSRRLLFFFAAAIALAFTYATPAQAGKTIWENPENPCNNFSLNGDVRYRIEQNEDTDRNTGNTADVTTKNTTREIRLRIGGVYNTGMGVSAGFRLTTEANSLFNQDQKLASLNGGNNGDFGTEQAYVQYAHSSGVWGYAGKKVIPILQLSGTWWDPDETPEGYVIGYSGVENLTVGVARYVITERSDGGSGSTSDGNEDDLVTALTVVYGMGAGPVALTLGATTATWANGQGSNKPANTKDVTYNLIVIGAKMDKLSGGIEYFTSNAGTSATDINMNAFYGATSGFESSDKSGYVINVRYQINDMFGVRAYLYDLGALSAPIPADDFQDQTNFTGTRLQLDIAFAGMDIDLVAYNQTSKNDDLGGINASKGENSRLQANFNVAF